MRIRFTEKVAIPGGPVYGPGDLADTDPHYIPPARALDFIRRGWALEIPMDATTKAPETQAPEGPPIHRMVTRERVSAKQP